MIGKQESQSASNVQRFAAALTCPSALDDIRAVAAASGIDAEEAVRQLVGLRRRLEDSAVRAVADQRIQWAPVAGGHISTITLPPGSPGGRFEVAYIPDQDDGDPLPCVAIARERFEREDDAACYHSHLVVVAESCAPRGQEDAEPDWAVAYVRAAMERAGSFREENARMADDDSQEQAREPRPAAWLVGPAEKVRDWVGRGRRRLVRAAASVLVTPSDPVPLDPLMSSTSESGRFSVLASSMNPLDDFNNARIGDIPAALKTEGRPGAAVLFHAVAGLVLEDAVPDEELLILGGELVNQALKRRSRGDAP